MVDLEEDPENVRYQHQKDSDYDSDEGCTDKYPGGTGAGPSGVVKGHRREGAACSGYQDDDTAENRSKASKSPRCVLATVSV